MTGEEDETNVLQMHCKLYQWDAEEAVWKEKGKGFLKLNDKKIKENDKLSSRLGQSSMALHSLPMYLLYSRCFCFSLLLSYRCSCCASASASTCATRWTQCSDEDVRDAERHPQLFPADGHELQQKQ